MGEKDPGPGRQRANGCSQEGLRYDGGGRGGEAGSLRWSQYSTRRMKKLVSQGAGQAGSRCAGPELGLPHVPGRRW